MNSPLEISWLFGNLVRETANCQAESVLAVPKAQAQSMHIYINSTWPTTLLNWFTGIFADRTKFQPQFPLGGKENTLKFHTEIVDCKRGHVIVILVSFTAWTQCNKDNSLLQRINATEEAHRGNRKITEQRPQVSFPFTWMLGSRKRSYCLWNPLRRNSMEHPALGGRLRSSPLPPRVPLAAPLSPWPIFLRFRSSRSPTHCPLRLAGNFRILSFVKCYRTTSKQGKTHNHISLSIQS